MKPNVNIQEIPLVFAGKWKTKTSPKGKTYRVVTFPLMLLPQVLEKYRLEPKEWFNYAPENGFVLGVRSVEDLDEIK